MNTDLENYKAMKKAFKECFEKEYEIRVEKNDSAQSYYRHYNDLNKDVGCTADFYDLPEHIQDEIKEELHQEIIAGVEDYITGNALELFTKFLEEC